MNEETITDALVDYANALEAATVNLKRRLADANYNKQTGQLHLPDASTAPAKPQPAYDPEKVNYTQRVGPKGSFELATPEENKGNVDFEVLTTVVKEQSPVYGKTHLYWLMQDGKSVGSAR